MKTEECLVEGVVGHYNVGVILFVDLQSKIKAGNSFQSKSGLMNYSKPYNSI